MAENNASDFITIIQPAIKYIIGFILGILFTPLKNWISSSQKEYCSFMFPFEPRTHNIQEIIVTIGLITFVESSRPPSPVSMTATFTLFFLK